MENGKENGEIESTYDETYARIDTVFGSDPEEILVKFKGLMNTSHPILDIGAGQGRNALFLANSGFNVHAVDSSPIAIQQLERISREKRLELNCQCCGFQELQKTEHCYSGILIFGLVQILDKKDVEILIRKISELCCQNALVFLTAFGVQDPSYLQYKQSWQEVDTNLFTDGNQNYRYFLASNKILSLFRGFEVIHHWEGLGKKHRHGNNPIEQHYMVEAVFRR